MLELCQVRRAQGISLGNDGDQVDTRAKSLHDLDVKRLQGVAGRADEVQAGMNTKVDLVLSTRLLLLEHVRFMLIVQELDDGHPRVAVVDVVAKSGGINDGQADCDGTKD